MPSSAWSEGFRMRLQTLLDRYGISKAEMARRSGLPPRTVENYFKGHTPGVEALISLSRGLGIDLDWLVGEADAAKSFNTDMVGEASWVVIKRFMDELIDHAANGETPVENGRILGKEPGQIAATIEARLVAEYLELRRQYAEPTLAAARELVVQKREPFNGV